MSRSRKNYYSDNEGNLIPLKPINASVGNARSAGTLGYHSFEHDLSGNITSAMSEGGQRVPFVNGLSPEEAATQSIRSRRTSNTASTTTVPPTATSGTVSPSKSTSTSTAAPSAKNPLFNGFDPSLPALVGAPAATALAVGFYHPDNFRPGAAAAPTSQPTNTTNTTGTTGTANPMPNGGFAPQGASAPTGSTGNAPRPTGLGGMPKPGAMWEGFGNAPATINLGRGAGVQGDGLPHDVAVVANALERNQPAAAPGFYGKISQSDPTHTVNPGEVAYVNGKPVSPGNSVTFVGAGQNGAVVQGMYDPAHYLPGGPKATTTTASTNTASPAPATPAAPGSLANLSGGAGALPSPSFAPTGGSSGTTARPLPADTATRQTPSAPAFNLATGATPTSEPPTGSLAKFSRPTPPQSTVAGSTIAARDIRTPQAPATPMEQVSNDARAGSSLVTATLQPTNTRVRRDGFGGDDDDELAAPAAPAPGGVTPLRSTQAAPAPATAPPTQVVPDAGNANSYIGTPDYGSQRVAPKSLGMATTPGSVTDAKGFYTGTASALAGVLGAPAATALTPGLYNPVDHLPGGTAAKPAAPAAATNGLDPERLRRLKAASSVVPGMAGVFGGFA